MGTIGQIFNSYMLAQWRPVRPTNMNVHSITINAKLVNNSNVTVDPTSHTVEETVNLTALERWLALVVYLVSSHLLYCKQ